MLKERREIVEGFMKIHSKSKFTRIMKRYGLDNIDDIRDIKVVGDRTSFVIVMNGGKKIVSGTLGYFPSFQLTGV